MKQTANDRRGAAPLWTKDYLLLLGSTILVWSAFHFLLVILPVYVTRELGATRAQIGLLATVLGISSVTARLVGGWACDRWGRKPVVLGFVALFVLVVLGHNLASTLAMLFLVRFVFGFPFGAGTTAIMTAVSDVVPARRRGEGIGYYSVAQTAANALGPALAFWVVARSGFGGIFNAAALLGVGALVLAWLVRYPQVKDPSVPFRPWSLLEKRVLWMSLAAVFIALSYSGVVTFASLYAEQVGAADAALFFGLFALGVLLIRPLAGRWFDRRGPDAPVLLGLAGMAAGMVMLALWRNPLGFHLSALLIGLGNGACLPSLQAMAVAVVPPERRGAASATFFALFDVGMTIGPYANGLLAEGRGGYPLVFLVGGAVLLVPGLMYFARVLPEYERRGA